MDSSIHLLDRPRALKPTEILTNTTRSSLLGLIHESDHDLRDIVVGTYEYRAAIEADVMLPFSG